MPDWLGVILVLVGFGVPWTWLLQRRAPEAKLEDFFDHLCFGQAISFVLLFIGAQLRLWLFAPIWAAGLLVAIAVAWLRPRPRVWTLHLGPEGWILLGASALYLALRVLPLVVRTLPLGWDAYFHMTIAETIVSRGRAVHDWLPYENIPLNYPIGAHLLMALAQWLSGARPHQFFDLMVVWFTLLSSLQLFSLATRATGDRRVGCYAALSYLFLADLGSLQYVMWSGLPNLIGMYMFLGLLSALTREQTSLARSSGVFATYFLAVCFVHHHVMVTAGLCLIWTAGVLFATGQRAQSTRIAAGLVLAAALGAPYFLMYLERALALGQTTIASYKEPAADAFGLARSIGFGFTLAVATGVCLFFRKSERVSAFVLQPLVAMLGMYLAVEFVLRTYSQVLFGREISPFTPSRFITDAVVLLALFAGIFFRTLEGSNPRLRLPLLAVICAGFFVFNRTTYRSTFRHTLRDGQVEAYEWIRTHTATDAALLDDDWHATYLSGRMTSGFPLPTSEYSALASNRVQLKRVRDGAQPPEQLQRQVLALVKPGRQLGQGKLLWEHRTGFRVVERYAPAHSE